MKAITVRLQKIKNKYCLGKKHDASASLSNRRYKNQEPGQDTFQSTKE